MARISPLGQLDCSYTKKKCFQLKKGGFLTGFLRGWADTGPSTSVTFFLHTHVEEVELHMTRLVSL